MAACQETARSSIWNNDSQKLAQVCKQKRPVPSPEDVLHEVAKLQQRLMQVDENMVFFS